MSPPSSPPATESSARRPDEQDQPQDQLMDAGQMDGGQENAAALAEPETTAFDETLLQPAGDAPAAAPMEPEPPAFDETLLQPAGDAPAAAPAPAAPEPPVFDETLLQPAGDAPAAAPAPAAPEPPVFDETLLQPAGDAPAAAPAPAAPEPPAFDETLLQPAEAAPAAAPAPAPAEPPVFDETLLQPAGDAPAAAPMEPENPATDDALRHAMEDAPVAAADQTVEEVLADDSPFDDALLDEAADADAADSLADPAGDEQNGAYTETVPTGPAAALAFFTDSNTEAAFCEGLFGYEGLSSDCSGPQVRQGDIRAAIAALAAGHTSQLIFVDIDGCSYPAGAIHELAAVCEFGTVVVAVGSDRSAGPGRELLLAGVRDYLAKPLTAEAVRAVVGYAAIPEEDIRPGGCAASFVGTGGSGTTTLTAAVALQAAARGCYVSVLDLNRSVAATALSLGVEPAAGLDQLLETAEGSAPEPEMLDAVCSRRSDRIAVYAHRWSSSQPEVPAAEAVDWVISALKRRSKLVLVEGIDALEMRFAPLAEVDTRVLVAEPSAGRAAEAARMMELLGTYDPLLFVQNHTRAFKKGAGGRAFLGAGIKSVPDVVVPFDPTLPDIADRGWPRSRLPRSLREPVTALTERLLSLLAGSAAGSIVPQQGL